MAYSVAFAPREVSFQALIPMAGTRDMVEQCIEEAKGEVGFDQYQVRHFRRGYRHITLTLMAHTWLAAQRAESREKNAEDQIDELMVSERRRILAVLLPLSACSVRKLLAWSYWRRQIRVIGRGFAIISIARGLNMLAPAQ